jgi:hypothetical protein
MFLTVVSNVLYVPKIPLKGVLCHLCSVVLINVVYCVYLGILSVKICDFRNVALVISLLYLYFGY